MLVITPLVAAVIFAYLYRVELFGTDRPMRIAAVVALVILGWFFASALGRALGPLLFRRLDAGTAGTVGFLIRLFTIAAAVLVALLAGLTPGTLATGGAVISILFGLAAQQTLGNLFAGTVLLSSQPFRLGDRIRLQQQHPRRSHGGKGLDTRPPLHHALERPEHDPRAQQRGAELRVIPLREPTALDLRARLHAGVGPTEVQALLADLETPVRSDPHIEREDVERHETVVRIEATPSSGADGAKLADEIIARLATVTSDGDGAGHLPRDDARTIPDDGAVSRANGHDPPDAANSERAFPVAGWTTSRGARRSCRGSSCGSGACARRSRPC